MLLKYRRKARNAFLSKRSTMLSIFPTTPCIKLLNAERSEYTAWKGLGVRVRLSQAHAKPILSP